MILFFFSAAALSLGLPVTLAMPSWTAPEALLAQALADEVGLSDILCSKA
jgi:hypothetical protein